jgi:hypothetical protein
MKLSVFVLGAVSASLLAGGVVAHLGAQDAVALSKVDAPPGSIWVDSLDLSKASIRRPRAGRGQAGQPPPPVVPLTYSLGGVKYEHAVPLLVNADLAIDLKGAATKFVAMVGLEVPWA